MTHVDDFIDNFKAPESETYARFVLNLFRLPASLRIDFAEQIKGIELYCTYTGDLERYRVTGASTMGDVWLRANFTQYDGYDKRVEVDYCINWSNKP